MDKTIAGIIALLFGGIGMHHFYLGNTTKGVMYLLFCWTFVPALLALIDAIQLFMMAEETFTRKYSK